MAARSQRDADRLQQGAGAVFTVARAAELLPLSTDEARRWLRDQGLVTRILDREVVCWGRVLEALARGDEPTTRPKPVPRPAIRRVPLG